MHGRVKIKTSIEKEAEALQAQTQLVAEHRQLWSSINELRRMQPTTTQSDAKLLKLSYELLLKNPDISTAFGVRRSIIIRASSKCSLEESQPVPKDETQKLYVMELELTKRCLMINPKSYSVWHHRKWTMLTMPNADWQQELKLCNYALDLDERNFHCWDYRRFVVKHGHVSTHAEFMYTREKIIKNFSNYSAWHYRSNILTELCSYCQPEGVKKLIDDEMKLVTSAMYTDPGDEAVWHYSEWLIHFVQHVAFSKDTTAGRENCDKVLNQLYEAVEEVISLEPNARRPLAMSFVIARDAKKRMDPDVAKARLATLCKEDSMRKNCYISLYKDFQ